MKFVIQTLYSKVFILIFQLIDHNPNILSLVKQLKKRSPYSHLSRFIQNFNTQPIFHTYIDVLIP